MHKLIPKIAAQVYNRNSYASISTLRDFSEHQRRAVKKFRKRVMHEGEAVLELDEDQDGEDDDDAKKGEKEDILLPAGKEALRRALDLETLAKEDQQQRLDTDWSFAYGGSH